MLNFFKKLFGRADVNKDGKVDAKDVKIVAEKVEAKVEAAAVKIQSEAKEAAAKAKTTVKKAAVKAKTARSSKAKPKA